MNYPNSWSAELRISHMMSIPQDQTPAPGAPLAADGAPAHHFVHDYLPALLALASQLISDEFHRVVRQHGFSVSEWRVMASLANGRAISVGVLAEMTVMKQPTLTRLLDRMEERGQVRRLPHDTDRRITLVGITPLGQETVSELIGLAREHERQVLQPFGLVRAEALKDTLREIIRLHAGYSFIDDDPI